MLELLERVDTDGSGTISKTEFQDCMADLEIVGSIEFLGVDTRNTDVLFNLLDVDGDGSIGIWELVEGLDRLKGNASSLDAHHLKSMVNHVMQQNFDILNMLEPNTRSSRPKLFRNLSKTMKK